MVLPFISITNLVVKREGGEEVTVVVLLAQNYNKHLTWPDHSKTTLYIQSKIRLAHKCPVQDKR